ncbi:uncharacterized protein CTRU02_215633 [Colletotrichum truncatum]|uniref:Uncharacterized protein n=1 Tax=Colletotrichum truncatum TaxID=5467 RepID=A0ACC3YC99_COLTU
MSYYTQITADDYTYEDGSSYDQAGLFGTPLDPTDVASFATSPSVIDLEDAQTIASSRLSRPPEHGLPLLQLADWDEDKSYDEQPPTCVHYSIEWKLTVNKKMVAEDSEQDLVLCPSAIWERILRGKLDRLLKKKLSAKKSYLVDDTSVRVSVQERSQRDFVKRFDELDIDWRMLERQLERWSQFFRAGKNIRIDMSFNYMETEESRTAAAPRGTKRGFASVSGERLAERDARINAEEQVLGRPSLWERLYSLFRCPGPPCNLGPLCWRDAVTKKHYKLYTHHLKSLLNFMEQGGSLQGHDDMPQNVREELCAEEQQRLERRGRSSSSTPTSNNTPPVTITNVIPAQAAQPGQLNLPTPLEISGLQDVAIEKYCDWLCSRVQRQNFKNQYRKAAELALDHCLDLEGLHDKQDVEFFTSNGIQLGAARCFITSIRKWAELQCDA